MSHYARRQSLLRDAQGACAATLLMEKSPKRCLIRIEPVKPFPEGCQVCLLRENSLLSLGTIRPREGFSAELEPSAYCCAPCVAVHLASKLIFAEGAAEDFQALRLLFLQHESARQQKAEKPKPPCPPAPAQRPEKASFPAFPAGWETDPEGLLHGLLRLSRPCNAASRQEGILSFWTPEAPPGIRGAYWENGVWWKKA